MKFISMRSKIRSLFVFLLVVFAQQAQADRIKDLTSVAGVRENQLIGFGLVVGLQGTGDGSDLAVTQESTRTMLERLGVSQQGGPSAFQFGLDQTQVPQPSAIEDQDLDNTAAVMVTADLPAFAKPGQRFDVSVSTIGPATSLRGGSLMMTRLYGADGEVYALAQGGLTVSGLSVEAAGSSVSIGVPSAGRIPNGAIVERAVPTPFTTSENLVLNVHESDFGTVFNIVNAVNETFGSGTARALDGTSLVLRAPADLDQRVAFISMVNELPVQPSEPPARVVINSRTGTVVISRNVRVSAAAVTHGQISVTVSAANTVSQPAPFSEGETREVQNADIDVEEPRVPMFLFEPGVELSEIVDAVNAVGATPSSLIAILEALKASGSLRAELVVI